MISPEQRELALAARKKIRKHLPITEPELTALRAYNAEAKRYHDQRKRNR